MTTMTSALPLGEMSSVLYESIFDEDIMRNAVARARELARRAYDTGDREQSNRCITGLSEAQRDDLRMADVYHCPSCGFMLKRRPITDAQMASLLPSELSVV